MNLVSPISYLRSKIIRDNKENIVFIDFLRKQDKAYLQTNKNDDEYLFTVCHSDLMINVLT